METKISAKEILPILAKIQSDIEFIKLKIMSEKEALESEQKGWETACVEDTSNFLIENSL